MLKSLFILVCASVRTCGDPQESFIIQFHEDAALGSSVSSLFDKKFHRIYNVYIFYCAYCVRVLVKLRNEIDARTFKAQLISGST